LNFYIHQFANGPELVMTALGATGVIFFTLSAYVLTTRKSFSYMGGFLAIAVMTAFLAGLASMIFNLPTLSLLVSGVFVLVSSGFILYHTSEIIQGGERNYIVATISLYIAIFNLFVNLLRLLSVFAGNRN
jgi:modulator of FtsH protease